MSEHTPRLQTLLEPMPSGEGNIADVMIEIPEELASCLRTIFQYEIMGDARFEGPAIYSALLKFADLVKAGKICQIDYRPDDENAQTLHVLCTIDPDKVIDAVNFVDDQLSDDPEIRCAKPIDLKDTVLQRRPVADCLPKTVGWFDLDHQRFLFVDIKALILFKGLFDLENIPTLDRELNFSARLGERMSGAQARLQKLADAWHQSMVAVFDSGQRIEVAPAPS